MCVHTPKVYGLIHKYTTTWTKPSVMSGMYHQQVKFQNTQPKVTSKNDHFLFLLVINVVYFLV